MTRLESDNLTELISGKHTLLVQLRELGKRQLEFIREGDLTGLLKLLSAKQHLLTGMQALERRLDPFRHQDPEQRQRRSAADRQACAQTNTQCEALLAEILQQEKHSELTLTDRRNEAARQLHGVHHASQARGAYAAAASGHAAVQLDLTSER